MTEVKLEESRVAWREVEDRIVVLDVEASEYFAVNPTGATLWTLLVDGASTDDLVQRIVETYGVDRDSAQRDVEGFLASLEERGLLSPA